MIHKTISILIHIALPMSFSQLIRSAKSISNGKAIHAQLIKSGSVYTDIQTVNNLLTLYLKRGHFDIAHKLLDEMPERNVVTYTTLISSYSQTGCPENALDLFRSMVLEDTEISPNSHTFVGVISACAYIQDLRTGKKVHGRIYRTLENVNSFVNNSLVNFYGKCGLLKYARRAFDASTEHNIVSWVSLISGYVHSGENEEALKVFVRSLRMGVRVNDFLCGCVLGACAALEVLGVGIQVQCLAVKGGVAMDRYVVTGLVNFYAKCGELNLACKAFEEVNEADLTAWTALIGGCVQSGKGRDAIGLSLRLLSSGLRPSEQTLLAMFGAFGKEKGIGGGMQLHGLIVKLGFDSFVSVCNSLLDFYAKCDCLENSLRTFWEMDDRDIVSWNAIVAGCVNSGHYEEATRYIRRMFVEGLSPNLYTYSTLLSLCGDLPAAEWGKQTHCCIIKPGFDANVVVGTALVDMYAKCGRLDNARKIFNMLPTKNLVSWNAIITGYAQHGYAKEALDIYEIMLRSGIEPNEVTFIGVLSSCGHVGLLEQGLHHFDSMTKVFGIIPKTDHIACMVSLFARKGEAKRAYDFISASAVKPDKVVWRSLLSGCMTSKDWELGKLAAKNILDIDPEDTSAHILLSNIYAESKMWSEASQIRKLMKDKALKKETGYSWTELKDKMYLFSSGNDMQLEPRGVHEVLDGLTAQLFDLGYVPLLPVSLAKGN